MSVISENTVPVASVSDTSDFDYSALMDEFLSINSHFETIEEWQDALIEFLQEKYPEMSEEDIAALEEKELQQQLYDEDILETLHSIHNGIVSQNAILEENNRLLESSLNTVSDNSVSQNSILTTKLEDYTLENQLSLFSIIIMLVVGFILISR